MERTRRTLLAGAAMAWAFGGAYVAQAADGPVIGILPKTVINDTFMASLSAEAEAQAKKHGLTPEVHSVSGHGAIEEQVAAVETLIARGVKGIALAALDSKGLAPVVKRAAQAGIPVVLIDSGVQTDPANYVSLVATDNVKAAGLAADYAAALLSGQGKVAQLEGEPGSEAAINRVKGFHEGIAKHPEIKLVSSITGHWTTPGGVEATEAILSAHPDVNLIFASSDLMAVGAAEVLKRQKRSDVIVVGFDGIPEGTQLVVEGRSAGDVSQSAKGMADTAIEMLAAIIKGEKKADAFPKAQYVDAKLLHRWNVAQYRKDVLGLAD